MTVQEKFKQYWEERTSNHVRTYGEYLEAHSAYLAAAKEAREEAIRECADVAMKLEAAEAKLAALQVELAEANQKGGEVATLYGNLSIQHHKLQVAARNYLDAPDWVEQARCEQALRGLLEGK